MKKYRRRRRRVVQADGGGNIFVDLLTLPVLGGPRLVHWMAKTLAEEAEKESLDEGRVRGELMELQERYDAAEIEEWEYDRRDKVLLEQLTAIRKAKAERT